MPAQLLRAEDGGFLCNGLVWDQQKFVFPRHCFASAESGHYKIRLDGYQGLISVRSLHFYHEDPRYFPSADIALVEVEKLKKLLFKPKTSSSKSLDEGERLVVWSWRKDAGCSQPGTCAMSLIKTEVKVQRVIDGLRIRSLLLVDSKSASDLCYGDSGSPVYREVQGQLQLLGFLTGRWYPFSPSSLLCGPKGHLVTLIEPYQHWLDGEPLPRKSSPVSEYQSLEAMCLRESWESRSWVTSQGILYRLLLTHKKELSTRSQQQIFESCTGVDHLWASFLASGRVLEFDFDPELSGMSFLQNLRALKLASLTPESVRQLYMLPQLNQLVINGAVDRFDWNSLVALQNLETLEILHVAEPLNLLESVAKLPKLKKLTFFNIRSSKPLGLEAFVRQHPQMLIQWQRWNDGKAPADGRAGKL